jgi:hypothetical protein
VLKVLVAEDNLMLADILADIFVKVGYGVCGIACTVDYAIELGLNQRPDRRSSTCGSPTEGLAPRSPTD